MMLSYMLLPAPIATAAWAGGLAVYYGVTSQNHPEHTGRLLSATTCSHKTFWVAWPSPVMHASLMVLVP